ncbi:MAG: TonB-dependent receptor [Bacteroidota bacterium]
MKKHFSLTFFLLVFSCCLYAQKFTVSGYVKDAKTGEFLMGANAYIKETMKGGQTNQYGYYSLTTDKGSYTFVVSYMGYKEYSTTINLYQNIKINIELEEKVITTKEVVITGEKEDNNTSSTDMGKVNLEVEKIKSLPAFMGEVDILKTIQLTPGVQNAGEGNSSFYVRGGGPDQNLILLDEAVVYNASHLFGFFSVFNADAVKNIELTKAGMPANYGGRLASVLDISMKEGNTHDYHIEGGIGLISSRLTIQGPIKKDTSSFIISGRRTYADLLIKPFVNKESAFKGSGYYFYDLNTKINYRFTDKDRLFLSGYFGRDIFSMKEKDLSFQNSISWGNATGCLRWNHVFGPKLFLNSSFIISDYQFELGITQSEYDLKLYSGVTDYTTKLDFYSFPSTRHKLKFGLENIYHIFTPNNATAKTSGVDLDLGQEVRLYSDEAALYINDEFDINDRIKINGGLRYSFFEHIGPFDRYIKDPAGQTIDSVHYDRFEKVQIYNNLEPRISLRCTINKQSSVKASYTQNYQYIHLASVSAISLPTDIWVPSSDIVKPQFGTQYSFGYFRNFRKNMFETSIEVYYKEMKNQIEFKEGALPEDNIKDNTDNNFTFGKGWSYGAEFFINKQLGQWTGWIGYTHSYTKRKFPEINQGREYWAKYDRRHDVSLVVSYEFNDRWIFSAIWVYATGNAMTMPIARYIIDGNIVNEYGERNGFRMPSYHRMDVSATFKGKKHKKYESSWNFSIYNVYNRYNPYYIYFDTEGNVADFHLETKAKQVSLFPILPSITWNFKF